MEDLDLCMLYIWFMWRNTHLAYMVVLSSCIKQFVDAAGSGLAQDGRFGDLLGA